MTPWIRTIRDAVTTYIRANAITTEPKPTRHAQRATSFAMKLFAHSNVQNGGCTRKTLASRVSRKTRISLVLKAREIVPFGERTTLHRTQETERTAVRRVPAGRSTGGQTNPLHY